MNQRRYSDEEIARIFKTATQTAEVVPQPPASGGLTLSDLQEIGREVGLSEEAVARAASRLDHAVVVGRRLPAGITRRYFSLPIRVGTSVELSRTLSDAEWEQLVADLRTTFDADGVIRVDSGRREWSGGGAHAVLEHTASGERFTLHLSKRSAPAWMWSAIVTFNAAAALFVPALAGLSINPIFVRAPVVLLGAGLAMFAYSAIKLPSWARSRRQQVDGVFTRLLAGMA